MQKQNIILLGVLELLLTVLIIAAILLLNSKINLLDLKIELLELQETQQKLKQRIIPATPEVQEQDSNIIFSKASWYDYTLDGVEWSKNHRTAAVRDWPRGTMLKVCNTENNKCVDVFVNDYGPSKEIHPDRAIDLSSYAFSQIANLQQGVINVSIKQL